MDVKIRTGFAPISHSINFDSEKISKGKNLAVSHVRRVEELQGNLSFIRASVVRTARVTEHPYSVSQEVNFLYIFR